nr:hypothetical protein [Tanacetum cinerariifolium]
MEEYIMLEEEKSRRNAKVYNWKTATYVFDDAFTYDVTPSYEPTVSLLNDNKINFRISFDEFNDEDYTVIYEENLFSYKIIYVNNLKMDFENDDDKVNMPSFPSPEPQEQYDVSYGLGYGVLIPVQLRSLKHTSESKTEASKSPTGQSKIETQSSSTKDKILSHPSSPTHVVDEINKEAQQATGGPTSLGATSEEGAPRQLISDSTAEANPGLSAPNDSIPPQQGMDEETKNTSYDHIFAGSNPNVLVDKTKFAEDGLKTVHTESGASKELEADEMSKKIRLKDLADLLKDTRSAFFTPDSSLDELINVLDKSDQEEKELEQLKAAAKAEVASLKVKPSYPDIDQLITLLVTSLKPKLAKLFTSHDLASCIPSELKELPSKVTELSLLNKVTNTLNRFATMVENASGATTMNVPSAGKAIASHAEGEKNTKDADTNLKNELVDLLDIDVVTQYYNKK